MRIGSILTAIAGICVAGGTVYLTRDMLEAQAGQQTILPPVETTVPVVIALQDIDFAAVIERDMLATIPWPRDHVPPGVFHSIDALLPEPGQPPRRSTRPITGGDPLRALTVSDFGERVTIVQTLSPNTRAVAIRVNAETSVGGFVTPGDRVDIVLTEGRGAELRAVTILQNVRIIGVDQDVDSTEGRITVARTVTVEVTAEQTQRLMLAQQAGTLSLSLRSLDDDDARELETLRLSDLLVDEVKEEVVAFEEPAAVIRVRRGTDVSETAPLGN